MKKYFLLALLFMILFPASISARRGCCSHHGGVAGCNSSGRQVCNDGTLSPTCTCTPTVTYIYGCTDPKAKNYNSRANKDDGSCLYYKYGCTDINSINYDSKADKDDGSCVKKVLGCMDESATNYNRLANVDDNSCEYLDKDEEDKEYIENTSSSKNNYNNSIEDSKEQPESENIFPGIAILGTIGGVVYLVKKKK